MPFSRVGLLVLLCPLLTLGACRKQPPAPPPVSPDAWAVIDGREIRRDEVEKAYRRVADPTARPSDDETLIAKLTLLDQLITQDLLLAKAKALGLEVTGTEIEAAFAERKKNMTDEAFQQELKQRGITPEDLKEDVRRELTTQKVIDHEVTSKIDVSDQAVRDHYNANRAQFNLAEPAYRIAQIVVTPVRDNSIANRRNDDATTPEAAAQKIKMLADRLKNGAQFSELAMDYSEDPQSAPQGGDLGLISASQLGQVAPPLRDAVLKAQPGTISQVSAGGAHTLVLLIAKEAPGQRDLASPGVRDNITGMLHDRQRQMLQAAFLTVLRDEAKIANRLAKQVLERPGKPPASVAPAAPGKKTP